MTLNKIYQRLLSTYGSQSWWPAETAFEVMVGSVLTQNTSWTNVEQAIEHLKTKNSLAASAIIRLPSKQLANMLKPVGYFNVKTKRLKNFCHWYEKQGGIDSLSRMDTKALRNELLSVNGVGPETADDILLYAFHRPVFVIDAYTRRIFARHGDIEGDEYYESLRHWFESKLSRVNDRVKVFNEYHALIVRHAKEACRKKPLCDECCLKRSCSRTGL